MIQETHCDFNIPLTLEKPVSWDEQKELFKQIKKKPENKEVLIKTNMRLVKHICYQFYKPLCPISFEDMFSIGCIGLVEAVNDFKLTKEAKFVTFASVCIMNKIKQELKKYTNGRRQFASLDVVIPAESNGKEDTITLCDTLQSPDVIEDTIVSKEIQKLVREEVHGLDPYYKELIIDSFYKGLSQREIAKKFKVNQSSVSRRTKEGMTILKYNLKKKGITI